MTTPGDLLRALDWAPALTCDMTGCDRPAAYRLDATHDDGTPCHRGPTDLILACMPHALHHGTQLVADLATGVRVVCDPHAETVTAQWRALERREVAS